jgi:hypothetical protein
MSSPVQVRMKVQLLASGVDCQPGDVLTLPLPVARIWVAADYCEILSPVEPEGSRVEAAALLPAAETTARPAARKRKR